MAAATPSTPPTSVIPPVSSLSQVESAATSWFKTHETLLIVFMSLIVGTFLVYKGLDIVSSYENHKAQQAIAVVQAQSNQNAADLTTVKQTLAAYQTALANATTANQTLAQAVTARNTVVVKQESTDATLPQSALGQRWETLVNDTGVTPTPTGFAVPEKAALDTVQSLEQVPVLTQDVKDAQAQTANDQIALTQANNVIDQGKTLVTGLQNQLTDETKSCSIQLSAAKAAANKGKFKWFGIGYVSGFVSGLVVAIVK
jgi:hypothetical protein